MSKYNKSRRKSNPRKLTNLGRPKPKRRSNRKSIKKSSSYLKNGKKYINKIIGINQDLWYLARNPRKTNKKTVMRLLGLLLVALLSLCAIKKLTGYGDCIAAEKLAGGTKDFMGYFSGKASELWSWLTSVKRDMKEVIEISAPGEAEEGEVVVENEVAAGGGGETIDYSIGAFSNYQDIENTMYGNNSYDIVYSLKNYNARINTLELDKLNEYFVDPSKATLPETIKVKVKVSKGKDSKDNKDSGDGKEIILDKHTTEKDVFFSGKYDDDDDNSIVVSNKRFVNFLKKAWWVGVGKLNEQ